MNDTTIKSHFISKCYLKSFEDKKDSRRAYTTSRVIIKGKVVWSPIKLMAISGICYIPNFFADFKGKRCTGAELEKKFQDDFENDWSKVIEKLQNYPFSLICVKDFTKNDIFDIKMRTTVINFIVDQHKRTPRMRADLLTMIKMPKKMRNKIKRTRVEKRSNLEEYIRHIAHVEFIKNDQPITKEMLKKSQWLLLLNNNYNSPFITSDAPVVWFTKESISVAIGNRKVIYIPLTPQHSLVILVNSHSEKLIIKNVDENDINMLNNLLRKRAEIANSQDSRLISNKKHLLELLRKKA